VAGVVMLRLVGVDAVVGGLDAGAKVAHDQLRDDDSPRHQVPDGP
jgi:hypothetical protein